jgi:hypothetical protein
MRFMLASARAQQGITRFVDLDVRCSGAVWPISTGTIAVCGIEGVRACGVLRWFLLPWPSVARSSSVVCWSFAANDRMVFMGIAGRLLGERVHFSRWHGCVLVGEPWIVRSRGMAIR